MRDYGKVHASFWGSATLKDLSSDARLLALYLLTSPHTNAAGSFRLPDAYACEDLGWVSEQLRNGFETLSNAGFVKRCAKTSWVWICKFHEWNKPDNPNILKSVRKLVESIPAAVSFRSEVLSAWGVFETVSEPLSNTPSPSTSPSLLESEEGEFEKLPLDDGSYFDIPPALVAEFTQAYPRVDLAAEFNKMRIWLVANPANRKTRRGMTKFLNSWLSRAPERGLSTVVPMAKPRRMLGS